MAAAVVCEVLTNKIDSLVAGPKIKKLEILGAHFHPYVTGLVS
ncbi:hypothetical protein RMR16_000975 [Agrobacterium sp. rho-13.3]|nr:hypothetical protein [Agrobacterium sp. rho-13.3]MDX8310499.1 hypothetical protein [Agrobacterium sp. rho-13.3]